MLCGGSTEPLYVILPYFNFCGFKRRRDLFVEFVARQSERGVRLVVVECLGQARLPKMKGVWQHITVRSSHHVWIKENLINYAVQQLPRTWKYMAWVDADITFLSPTWVQDTIDELRRNDVVQLFQTCVNLGPNDEALKIDKGFGYMHRGSGTPYTRSDKYGFWHPGYAWACTRVAYAKMHGLLDWAILGSGDRHMTLAWIGRAVESAPGNVHPTYKEMLREYEDRCKGFKVSYIDGTILHHWHGRFADRRYRERWSILVDGKYDPMEDVGLTRDGIIQLTRPGLRFVGALDDYFVGRKEDLMSV